MLATNSENKILLHIILSTIAITGGWLFLKSNIDGLNNTTATAFVLLHIATNTLLELLAKKKKRNHVHDNIKSLIILASTSVFFAINYTSMYSDNTQQPITQLYGFTLNAPAPRELPEHHDFYIATNTHTPNNNMLHLRSKTTPLTRLNISLNNDNTINKIHARIEVLPASLQKQLSPIEQLRIRYNAHKHLSTLIDNFYGEKDSPFYKTTKFDGHNTLFITQSEDDCCIDITIATTSETKPPPAPTDTYIDNLIKQTKNQLTESIFL